MVGAPPSERQPSVSTPVPTRPAAIGFALTGLRPDRGVAWVHGRIVDRIVWRGSVPHFGFGSDA